MKKRIALSALVVVVSCLMAFSQTPAGDSDFTPGLLIGAVIMAMGFLVLIGVGIVLAALVFGFVAVLVSAGVLSTSVIVGLNKRSFTKGFKTFIYLLPSSFGLLLGALCLALLNMITHWFSTGIATLIGAASGLTAGLCIGVLVLFAIQRLTTHYKRRFYAAVTGI
jgi:hypothetical protein